MSVGDLQKRLIAIVNRVPVEQLVIVGSDVSACINELAFAGEGSEGLDEIRRYFSQVIGEAMTKAEDTLREGRDRLSLYAAML